MIERTKQAVRTIMRNLARVLNKLSRSKLTPNGVTIFGLVMHIPIAWLISVRSNYWAAGLLVVFGLFDTLDGELARLQNRMTANGRLLDSVTDRMKEILLYIGSAYAIIASTSKPYLAVWAVAACGCSLLTSYVNAVGDSIMAEQKETKHLANKTFRSGLLPFEVRMVVLIVGLFSNRVSLAVIVISLGAAYTALSRMYTVYIRIKGLNV